MASILLETIINDTVDNIRSLGDHNGNALSALKFPNESLRLNNAQSVATMSTNNSTQLQHIAPPSDQLDSLGTLLQDVEMGSTERLFWIMLFFLMVLVAAGGNIIVIHIVSTNKEMKSVTNYFLVNLSLADTMVSTLNVIFNFISMLNR